jgi:hypothetical protein
MRVMDIFRGRKQKNGTEIMHIFTQERLQVACVRMGQTQTDRQTETLGCVSGETQERELKWTKKVTKRGGLDSNDESHRQAQRVNQVETTTINVNRLNRDPVQTTTPPPARAAALFAHHHPPTHTSNNDDDDVQAALGALSRESCRHIII